MLGQYLPIFAMLVLAIAFTALNLLITRIVSPKRSTEAKTAPYECGIVPGSDTPERFPVRFFLVAMIFIVFDIEIIFMYPWSMIYRSLGTYGLVAIGIFSFLVFESFVYLIGNGALDWGPIKKAMPAARTQLASATGAGRQGATRSGAGVRSVAGVRTVGREGREAA